MRHSILPSSPSFPSSLSLFTAVFWSVMMVCLSTMPAAGGPAVVTFGGDLTLSETSTLHIELGGENLGDFDRLEIGGNALLSGALSVAEVNGFTVGSGDAFTILEVSGLSGTFGGLAQGAMVDVLSNRGLAIDYQGGDGNDVVLRVVDPPLFSKVFLPNMIATGATSTLRFSIDASSAPADVPGLAFTDSLPTGLVVATPPNAVQTCGTGVVTAVSGATSISYSGGTVSAGSICTISLDVTSSAVGSYANTSTTLVSDAGIGATATDTLVVVAPPAFAKAFMPDTVLVGSTSTLRFSIDSSTNVATVSGLAFTDDLPAGIQVAPTPNASHDCASGVLSADPGASSIAFSAGTLAAGGSCDVSVDVIATAAGSHVNTSGALIFSLGSGGTATDTLVAIGSPGFSKAFAPEVIAGQEISTLTFTIDNTANALAVGDLAFTDDLPAGLRVAPTPATSVTCTGGDLVATARATSISYSDGVVDAGSSCTVSVDVLGGAAGSYLNTSGALASAAGTGSVAIATLAIHQRPGFAKSFFPDPIFPGETSTLTFTVDNSAGGAAVTDLAFTDPLPSGLMVATPNGALDGCAGSLDAIAGGTTISYSGGTVAAGATCTLSVETTSAASGIYDNQSSALSSSAGFGLGNGPPSLEWAAGVGESGSVLGQSVAVDTSGNVVNVGWFSGTADFDPGPGTRTLTSTLFDNPYALMLDENGDFVWAASADGFNGRSKGVAVDSAGNVLVSGFIIGEVDFDPGAGTFPLDGGSSDNAFVWKLDSAGNLAWAVGLTEPVNGSDSASGIATDADGNVYVTGQFANISDFDPGPGTHNLDISGVNAFIWKLDSSGNLVWVRSTRGSGGGGRTTAQGLGLTVDGSGNVYVAGQFSGTVDFDPSEATLDLSPVGSSDAFVWKLDRDGNFVWAVSAGGTSADRATGVVVDSVGGVSFTGFFEGTVDFDPGPGVAELTSTGGVEGFVAQLTDTGAFSWAGSVGGGDGDFPFGIAVDPSDNLHVGVTFSGTADFDPGPATFNMAAAGNENVAVLKLDASGGFLSAGRLGGDPSDFTRVGTANSIAVSDHGSVLVTGFFTGTTDLDPGAGTENITADVGVNTFVAQFGASGATDTLVVNPLTDLAVSFSDSPDPVAAGASLTYTAMVTNHGPSNSGGATVSIPLAGAAFLSSSDCTEASGTVTCAMDALDSGASQSVSFVVTVDSARTAAINQTATVAASDSDPEMGNNSASSTTAVIAETDLLISTVDSPDPVIAGNNLTYTMTVTNNGPSLSTGSSVSDVLPSGLAFSSSSDCTEGGGTVTCAIVSLAVGASKSVSFVAAVDSGRTTAISNTATVSGNETDPVAANNSATLATTVSAEADLSISKVDSPDPVVAGEDLTFTVTVTNNGPSASSGASVSDVLPAGVTFSSTSDCTESSGTVTCAIDALAVGANQSVGFVVTVDSGQTVAISNTATVTGNETDPVASNNSATSVTTVGAEADLSISKVDSPDPVVAGEDLTFTLTVTNHGPSASSGGSVSDVLPAGVTFSSSSDCTEFVGTVTCAIDALAVGASQGVGFVVTVDPGQTAAISNTATVTGNETDPVAPNNSATSTSTVSAEADLSIIKNGTPDPVVAGEDLTYTMTVTNHGPSASSGGSVSDVLPAGVTFSSSSDCTESVGTVTCPIEALIVGADQIVSFVVQVDSGQTAPLSNTATVTGNEIDPVSGNNSATTTTNVSAEADLVLEKSDSVDPVTGATFSYILEVTNHGPSDATGVVATDLLPSGLIFASSADDCTEANGTVSCAFGAVPAGQSRSLSFVVMLEPPILAVVTNIASASGNELDPTPSNNSASEVTQLDDLPPTVVHVTTVNDTSDGELTHCETVLTQVGKVLVTFSESVQDPPGDGDANDVTHAGNYLLVSAGPDHSFQTDQCGTAVGDDDAVAVSAVTYDEVSATATLAMSALLPNDLYRLFVCGSTSIHDLAGNSLDGDDDGVGGDDFVRFFRVDSGNRLANGHFDCDLGSWLMVSTNPAEIAHAAEDVDGSVESGSAMVENLTASNNFGLGQCAAISPRANYDFGVGVRLASTALGIGVRLACTFYDSADCAGSEMGEPLASTTFLGNTGTTWVDLGSSLTAPVGALSTLCSVDFVAATGEAFEASVDQVRLVTTGDIFSDGFESGETSAWSAFVP